LTPEQITKAKDTATFHGLIAELEAVGREIKRIKAYVADMMPQREQERVRPYRFPKIKPTHRD